MKLPVDCRSLTNGYVGKQQVTVAILKKHRGVLLVSTTETETQPPVTSKSKAAGTDPYVESSIKQQNSAHRVEICLHICGRSGKEGICACICGAGGVRGGRRTSKLHVMLSVNSTRSELGKNFSSIFRVLPPDYRKGFTLTYVELGTFNFHLISHPFRMYVCIYTCAYLTELPVPADNMRYLRRKQLTPFCFIAHLTIPNVQAKEIPKRSAFCHSEAGLKYQRKATPYYYHQYINTVSETQLLWLLLCFNVQHSFLLCSV